MYWHSVNGLDVRREINLDAGGGRWYLLWIRYGILIKIYFRTKTMKTEWW